MDQVSIETRTTKRPSSTYIDNKWPFWLADWLSSQSWFVLRKVSWVKLLEMKKTILLTNVNMGGPAYRSIYLSVGISIHPIHLLVQTTLGQILKLSRKQERASHKLMVHDNRPFRKESNLKPKLESLFHFACSPNPDIEMIETRTLYQMRQVLLEAIVSKDQLGVRHHNNFLGSIHSPAFPSILNGSVQTQRGVTMKFLSSLFFSLSSYRHSCVH